MKKRLWILIAIIIVLLFSLAFNIKIGSKPEAGSLEEKETVKIGVEVGSIAPDFSLYDLQGKLHSLKAVRGKKVVLLVFWATWCSYCVDEIPELIKIHKEYSKRKVEVWGINISEGRDKISKFASKRRINYTILFDSEGNIASLYKIIGIPANIILDKKGIVRYNGELPKNYDAIFAELTGSRGKNE